MWASQKISCRSSTVNETLTHPHPQNTGLLLLKNVFYCFKNRPGNVFDFAITVFADFYDEWNLDKGICTETVQGQDDELVSFFL